jgi:hypothetical protein
MRKTKIVATIGPSSESEEMLEKLMNAGLNVARFNMSHGSYEEHLAKIEKVKKLNKKLGKNVGLMLDTKGPEIRLGVFDGDTALLVQGAEFTLTTEEVLGNTEKATVTYKGIVDDVNDDGSYNIQPIGSFYEENNPKTIFNTGVWKGINSVCIFQNLSKGDEVLLLTNSVGNKVNSIIIGVYQQKTKNKFQNVLKTMRYLVENFNTIVKNYNKLINEFDTYKKDTDEKIKNLENNISSLQDRVSSLGGNLIS